MRGDRFARAAFPRVQGRVRPGELSRLTLPPRPHFFMFAAKSHTEDCSIRINAVSDMSFLGRRHSRSAIAYKPGRAEHQRPGTTRR